MMVGGWHEAISRQVDTSTLPYSGLVPMARLNVQGWGGVCGELSQFLVRGGLVGAGGRESVFGRRMLPAWVWGYN